MRKKNQNHKLKSLQRLKKNQNQKLEVQENKTNNTTTEQP
jgi:hypothetical protein